MRDRSSSRLEVGRFLVRKDALLQLAVQISAPRMKLSFLRSLKAEFRQCLLNAPKPEMLVSTLKSEGERMIQDVGIRCLQTSTMLSSSPKLTPLTDDLDCYERASLASPQSMFCLRCRSIGPASSGSQAYFHVLELYLPDLVGVWG